MNPFASSTREGNRSRVRVIWTAIVISCLGIAFWAVQAEAYHSVAFQSVNTGSRYGYKQLPFGGRYGHWTRRSPFESYLIEKGHPVANKWTKIAETGKSFYGRSISFSCGRTYPIYMFKDATQHRWLEEAPEREVVDFYAILTTGTFAQMEAACRKILLKYDP
ncbi:MAG: hypothetical protein ABL962_04290 [Fimbriimonadaceae bacterium]